MAKRKTISYADRHITASLILEDLLLSHLGVVVQNHECASEVRFVINPYSNLSQPPHSHIQDEAL